MKKKQILYCIGFASFLEWGVAKKVLEYPDHKLFYPELCS